MIIYDCEIFLYFLEFCAHAKTATLLHPSGMMTIGHFTDTDGSEADGDLVLIQTFLLCCVNQVILMLTSIFQGQFP